MPDLGHADLNRAVLARQGLLEPLDVGVAAGLRAVGAVQAQQWTAVPVALATRLKAFEPGDLWAALDAGEALTGIGIRGTLHLVAADEHPAYAATARAGGVGDPAPYWPEAGGPGDAAADAAVGCAVLAAAQAPGSGDAGGSPAATAVGAPLTPAAVAEVAEAWVGDHPGTYSTAALATRRDRKWRPLQRRPDLVRVPTAGAWSARTPPASQAAPWRDPTGDWPAAETAVAACVAAHLRAFGPATIADTAQWLGVGAGLVRAAVDRLDGTVTLTGPGGAALHDLAAAPRPDGETPAPPRFLAAFDSLLLAYAPGARERILGADLQRVVYKPGNLRIDPSFLLDGRVAGTWSLTVKRRAATIEVRPAARLRARDLTGLEQEGERLLRALTPAAATRAVRVA